MVVGLEGRPLKRNEERRIAVRTTERQPGSRTHGSSRPYPTLSPKPEFTPLFVLGMLGGIAAVFIAFFMH
jgi:hypothetical protein